MIFTMWIQTIFFPLETHSQCLKITQNVAFWIFALFTNFCTVSIDLSSNTIRPQNVKVARFARNVKWDFFCDFQPLRFRFSILPPSCCSFLIQFHNGANYANTALCRLLLEAVSAENRPTLSWTMRWPIYNWILCWTWLPLFLHIDTNRTRIQVQLAF